MGMNSNQPNYPAIHTAQDKPNFPENLRETLSQQINKGLSQPPSRSQVPPATASEEIVQ